MIDSRTKHVLDNLTLKPNLDVVTIVKLDKYTNETRRTMESKNIFTEFLLNKAVVMLHALRYHTDVMLLDTDILFMNPINIIDKSKEVGLSPHYTKKINTDEVGYYNVGVLWTNNSNVVNDWVKFTKTSRYFEQASLEDLAKKYRHQEFGEEINVMPWRILVGSNPTYVSKCINLKNNNIYYKDKPLVFIHTHFLDGRFREFNLLIIRGLLALRRYKEMAIIERIINNSWLIKIPKQPKDGMWKHPNNGFRELTVLLQKNNVDIKFQATDSGHCWLSPNICLYDRTN